MDTSKTITEYLNELSSASPTPGGGNVSAFCAALSASLGTMVCNLTIGKKKYAEVETEINMLKARLETYNRTFLELARRDNAAFDDVMAAFKLPKDSEEEKIARHKQIELATLGASRVPFEVINNCHEMLPLIDTIINKGNQNSLSDAGVAALLINTASQGAFLNVMINCASIKSSQEASELLNRAREMTNELKILTNSLIEKIEKRLEL